MLTDSKNVVAKLKKGDVARALVMVCTLTEGLFVFNPKVVRTRKEVARMDGSFIKWDDNAVVMLDKKVNFTRVSCTFLFCKLLL
jgi:large subunit ribosomal protein L14